MKKRTKKKLKNMIKRSPIIAFSIENLVNKHDVVRDLTIFNEFEGLTDTYLTSTTFLSMKEEMIGNLLSFTDNYLSCGGHAFIYLLIPLSEGTYSEGTYKVLEKECKDDWSAMYWKKEDPNRKRDWCYMGEDMHDLFDYITEKFEKANA